MQLLHARSRILSIKHEGVEIERSQFDRMLKIASPTFATGRENRRILRVRGSGRLMGSRAGREKGV